MPNTYQMADGSMRSFETPRERLLRLCGDRLRISGADARGNYGRLWLDGVLLWDGDVSSLQQRLQTLPADEAIRRTLAAIPARRAAQVARDATITEQQRTCSHRWVFHSHEEERCPRCDSYRMPPGIAFEDL